MALLEKHRNTIYTAMVDLMGEEAAQAMVSQFPARDVEEPLTRADLTATEQTLRLEMAKMETRLMRTMLGLSAAGLTVIGLMLNYIR